MGANFETMTVKGTGDRKVVESEFANAQAQDRYDNGHSYSGGFGMATGLEFVDRHFASRDQAHDFLSDTCVKWQAAKAVLYTDSNGDPMWLIGAVCAS